MPTVRRGLVATLLTLSVMVTIAGPASGAVTLQAPTVVSTGVGIDVADRQEQPQGPRSTRWYDPTTYWASPGANWIAWELNQVNPAWRVQAGGLDQFANAWCFAQNPQQLGVAVDRLILNTIPGADVRTLPALGQMLTMIEQSCISQGGNPSTVDYWIQATANYMMTVVRDNTRAQIRAGETSWTRPVRVAKQARTSISSQVISGACAAAVDIGANALAGKFTKLAGLKQVGLLGIAKVGCNGVVTKVWKKIFG